jgi:hypothetical protein
MLVDDFNVEDFEEELRRTELYLNMNSMGQGRGKRVDISSLLSVATHVNMLNNIPIILYCRQK